MKGERGFFSLRSVLAEGLVVIETWRTESTDLWTICTTRKAHRCAACALRYDKGSRMWRPITNGTHRGWRLCAGCAGVLRLECERESEQR